MHIISNVSKSYVVLNKEQKYPTNNFYKSATSKNVFESHNCYTSEKPQLFLPNILLFTRGKYKICKNQTFFFKKVLKKQIRVDILKYLALKFLIIMNTNNLPIQLLKKYVEWLLLLNCSMTIQHNIVNLLVLLEFFIIFVTLPICNYTCL